MNKTNFIKKSFKLIFVFILLLSTLSVSVFALSFSRVYEPGDNYRTVDSRDVYLLKNTIDTSSIGINEGLKGLKDVFSDKKGNIYLLCNENSSVVVLNNDYSYNRTIKFKEKNGADIQFSGAEGVYSDNNEKIYICDAAAGTVYVSDPLGNVIQKIGKPKSNLIPNEFIFAPRRIIKDKDDFTYILSGGCYYGLLVYTPEGEFNGFFGANTVDATALDTLSYLWELLTSNDTKKAASQKTLPYSFVDLTYGNDNYILCCTGTKSVGSNGKGQIRKMSPKGSNILYKKTKSGKSTTSDSSNFVESTIVSRNKVTKTQNIISIDTDEYGNIYALDKTYGIIYIYDKECNLLSGFGGYTNDNSIKGVFSSAESLTIHNKDLLVIDSDKDSLSVYERTEFGSLLMKAESLQIVGDYEEATPLWKDVLSADSGNQLAYSGLARYSYIKGDNKSAIKYAESAMDYNTYDLARQAQVKDFFVNNFGIILAIGVLLVLGIIAFLIYKSKKKIVLVRNKQFKLLIQAPIHPFNVFGEIKEKKTGSLKISFGLTVLFFVGEVLEATASGFLFRTESPTQYSIFDSLIKTLGLLGLWVVCNWLICSLFEGKGTLQEVFIATAYSVMPIILYKYVYVIFSHILPYSGMEFLFGLKQILLLYTAFILIIAIMKIHEFEFGKFILSTVITICGMILVVFVLFMMMILLKQFANFVTSIYMEIVYR